MRLYILVAIFLAGLAAGGAGGWQARAWKAGADERDRLAAEAETQRLRAKVVDQAAEGLEARKAAAEIRWRTVTKEVERVVETPVYRAECLDADGLRLIAAEVGTRAASQPASAVPGPAASGAH